MLSFCVTDCGIPSRPPDPQNNCVTRKIHKTCVLLTNLSNYLEPKSEWKLAPSPNNNNNWPENLWYLIFLINSVAAQEFLFQYPNPVGHNRAIKAPCAM